MFDLKVVDCLNRRAKSEPNCRWICWIDVWFVCMCGFMCCIVSERACTRKLSNRWKVSLICDFDIWKHLRNQEQETSWKSEMHFHKQNISWQIELSNGRRCWKSSFIGALTVSFKRSRRKCFYCKAEVSFESGTVSCLSRSKINSTRIAERYAGIGRQYGEIAFACIIYLFITLKRLFCFEWKPHRETVTT